MSLQAEFMIGRINKRPLNPYETTSWITLLFKWIRGEGLELSVFSLTV